MLQGFPTRHALRRLASCAARLVAGLWLLWLGLGAAPAAALTTLEHAQARFEVEGRAPRSEAVELPLHWDAKFFGAAGRAHLAFDVAADAVTAPAAVDHALMLIRVGNTYRIRFNGVLVADGGEAGDAHDDFSKRPRFVRLPAALVRATNRLEIEIDAQSTRKAGVSPVLFGSVDEVLPIYESQTACACRARSRSRSSAACWARSRCCCGSASTTACT